MSIYKQNLPYRPLAVTPASRITDSLGSSDAEDRINASGTRASDQRKVLAAFVAHPGATTKEISALEALDRVMVARRTPELSPVYLTRMKAPPGTPKGERDLRWYPTDAGKAMAERLRVKRGGA